MNEQNARQVTTMADSQASAFHRWRDVRGDIDTDPVRRAAADEAYDEALDEVVAYSLRELRSMRRLTQSELARLLEVDQSRVSRIENGGRPLQLDTLQAFIERLGGRLEISAVFDDERFPIALEESA